MNFAHTASAADDATLVARYVAGDDLAFSFLLRRHQARVFTTILLIVRDRAMAEDLTQETFIKAIHTLRDGRYAEAGRFGPWVCRVAHNLAIDSTRRRKNQPMVSLDAPVGSDSTDTPLLSRLVVSSSAPELSPEALTIREESNEQLRRLIQELPLAQRQVLLMRHYGDLSFKEIAAATGVSVNTAMARMRYALRKLRHKMTVTGTSAALLAAVVTTITSPPAYPNDPSFYPGNADPVRLQRAAG